jgi:hypothetical protein
MSADLLDLPAAQAATGKTQFAKQLRKECAAVRLGRAKWNISKRLDRAQVQKAAAPFGAEAERLAATKKLINSRNEKYASPCATLREAVEAWKDMTVPFPEKGVRLIRKDRIEDFVAVMSALKARLATEAADLEAACEQLQVEAQVKLGDLFNEADYPADVASLFKLDWDFPSVDPPAYLQAISPALYEQQKARIEARFEEAVALAEEAFVEQFHKLVAHLAERLEFGDEVDEKTGQKKPKVFRDSAIEGLQKFFEQFKAMSLGSNPDLEALVEQAQEIVANKSAKDLRANVVDRQTVQQSFTELAGKLDALMVNRPARSMLFDTDEE